MTSVTDGQQARVREPGAVMSIYPLISGLLVVGWTDSPRRIWHPQELVLPVEQKRMSDLEESFQPAHQEG